MENVHPVFDIFLNGVPVSIRVVEVSFEDPADPDDPKAHEIIAEALEESKKGKTAEERHVGVLRLGESPVGAVVTAPEDPISIGYLVVDVVSVSCRDGKAGVDAAMGMFAVLKRAADLVDGRRLLVPSVGDPDDGDALLAALKRAAPAWTPVPSAGGYVYGPLPGEHGALQLTPTRAMLVSLPADPSARPKPAKSIVSGAELGPYVRQIAELDPPAKTLKEVWRRTNCGFGNKHENWVPFLRISGTKNWLRADSYAGHCL